MANVEDAKTPSFYVREIPIYGRAILSPMAGYSDVPYRAICRAYGSSMHYTEFVPVDALLGKPSRHRFWRRLDQVPGENPMVFQIFGNDPKMILDAALNIRQLNPDIIDINMGCSTRRVSGRGAGVGMMRNPAVIAETFHLLSSHLDIPVTGKIRLGFDDHQNYLEVAKILEDNGASLIAMHGRTKEQKYTGTADWDAIAALKQAVGVPVIGNGDVTQPEHIQEMIDYTGVDGVMIGRGAIGNPWIFAGHHRDRLPFHAIAEGVRIHIEHMTAYFGEAGGLVQFRKHFKRYVEGFPQIEPWMERFLSTVCRDEFESTLAEVESMIGTLFPNRAVALEPEIPVADC